MRVNGQKRGHEHKPSPSQHQHQQQQDLNCTRKTIMAKSVQLRQQQQDAWRYRRNNPLKLSSRPKIVMLVALVVVVVSQLTATHVVICEKQNENESNDKRHQEVSFRLKRFSTIATRDVGLDFLRDEQNNSDRDDATEAFSSRNIFLRRRELPEPSALGAPLGERPKLIPLVAAESGYNENSSVNILCTVSSGHHESLIFDWFKDNQPITDSMSAINQNNYNNNFAFLENSSDSPPAKPIQVDKHADHSLLRISQVQAWHSGRYTCSAKNQFGSDSSSVTLRVNVKLHWTREPPREVIVSANQELKLDCLAHGEPKPLTRWEKIQQQQSEWSSFSSQKPSGGPKINGAPSSHNSHQTTARNGLFNGQGSSVLVSSGRYLNIARARENDSGLYECIANNGNDADLRKIVHVQVRGLYTNWVSMTRSDGSRSIGDATSRFRGLVIRESRTTTRHHSRFQQSTIFPPLAREVYSQ